MFGRPSRRRHTNGQMRVNACCRWMCRLANSWRRRSHCRSISGSKRGNFRLILVKYRLSLRLSPIRYLLRPKTRFPVRRLHLLSGREFHPLEAPGLSWRATMQIDLQIRGSRAQHAHLQSTPPQPKRPAANHRTPAPSRSDATIDMVAMHRSAQSQQARRAPAQMRWPCETS